MGLTEHARDCARDGKQDLAAQIELSAAALAVHVADWHALPGDLDGALRDRFKTFSPDWSTLKSIVNGVKHPLVQPGPHELREPEWEDVDFWETSGLGPMLFVKIDGHWRSVLALTVSFCAAYIARGHEI